MWVTSLGLAGEAGIFASRPFYPMFSGVPNGPLRLSPPQVHAAVHNSGEMLVGVFNAGIAAVRDGSLGDARRILNFPEVAEIGFGYTQKSRRGSGVGNYLSGLIIETLKGSSGLLESGVGHVEEMQLMSVGIGPDRVSDISANILKRFLIDYTQRQCAIWNIPIKSGVPVSHIYDHSSQTWRDSHEDCPSVPRTARQSYWCRVVLFGLFRGSTTVTFCGLNSALI